MPNEILMPQLPSREEGRLARWFVSEGQLVAPGDVIAEIETDTATLEIEAAGQGRIGRILVPAGAAIVRPATPLATVLQDDSDGRRSLRSVGGNGEAAASDADGWISSGACFVSAGAVASIQPPQGHGAEPLPPASGRTRTISYREALRDGLAEEMRRDPTVFLIGAGVAQNAGASEVTQGLADEFGTGRVVEVAPVVEAYTGLAIGAAMNGLKPVVVYPSWIKALPAFRQIMTSAAGGLRSSGGALAMPIVFRAPLDGEAGEEVAEAAGLAAWLTTIPELRTAAPVTPGSAKAVLKAAVRDPGPVAIIEYQSLYECRGEVADDAEALPPLGIARLARKGTGPTIVAMGSAVAPAEAAATLLAARGIAAEVIDLVSLSPIDWKTVVSSVCRTGHLVVASGGELEDSVGAKIVAGLATEAFQHLAAAPRRAPPNEIEIVAAVQALVAAAR